MSVVQVVVLVACAVGLAAAVCWLAMRTAVRRVRRERASDLDRAWRRGL